MAIKYYLQAIIILSLATVLLNCNSEPSFYSRDISSSSISSNGIELTDHNGEKFNLSQLEGNIVLSFFGFTHCPDACPTALIRARSLMDKLGDDKADQVQVLFITVDPQRDTQELLKRYVEAFDKRFIGLYGSEEEIKKISDNFGVYYKKVPAQDSDNYLVDHSLYSYVHGKDGNIRLLVDYTTTSDELLSDIRQLLD